MNNTNDSFGKQKIVVLLTALSQCVLCIQHFWQFCASSPQEIAYIPLLITWVTVAINEIGSAYKKGKKIVICASACVGFIAFAGLNVLAANNVGIGIQSVLFNKGIYAVTAIGSLFLSILEIEKFFKI